MTRNLVSQPLLRALSSKRPSAGVMHHSDRGSQYCSREYRSLLKRFGLQTSMSGTGNCFDNAPMESFWGTLKQELVHHRHYRSRREPVRDITEYVKVFYNRQRRQTRPGFLSPAAYEKRRYAGLLPASKVWCPLLPSNPNWRGGRIRGHKRGRDSHRDASNGREDWRHGHPVPCVSICGGGARRTSDCGGRPKARRETGGATKPPTRGLHMRQPVPILSVEETRHKARLGEAAGCVARKV